jgi:S-DNA-T family DNA segregation ATPase FtsK/SpoIIIE
MQYEIDQIREDIPNGIIEIHYSKTPMDELYVAETEDLGSCRFVIGKSRAKVLYGDLRKTPHLLVAGQTGGGKSTFLQQLITSLMIHNKSMQFHLVDLKGGLEFGAFEEIPRFRVASDLTSASSLLTSLEVEMKTRLETLKENTSKNLDEFNLKATENKKAHLHRIMVIVDEAAEMFLARSGQSYKSIQDSRQTISKIARQGRSIGIHLVIATQRPDSNALDSQVKSNLPGVLCFQMVNDSSSISVLGNGRAKLLPPVAGRAIWKEGSKMIEVQTPLLTSQAQATILKTLEPRDNSRKVNSTEAVPVSTILMSRDEIERKEVNQNATEVQEEPGAAS